MQVFSFKKNWKNILHFETCSLRQYVYVKWFHQGFVGPAYFQVLSKVSLYSLAYSFFHFLPDGFHGSKAEVETSNQIYPTGNFLFGMHSMVLWKFELVARFKYIVSSKNPNSQHNL